MLLDRSLLVLSSSVTRKQMPSPTPTVICERTTEHAGRCVPGMPRRGSRPYYTLIPAVLKLKIILSLDLLNSFIEKYKYQSENNPRKAYLIQYVT
jgi:hypothetical protein